MSYEPPSRERNDRLTRKKIAETRHLARFVPSFGTQAEISTIGSGSKDMSIGPVMSDFALNPEVHTLSGTFSDTIELTSSSIIVDGTGSNLFLRAINGASHDGQFITIKPKDGKTVTLEYAFGYGNVDVPSTTVVSDSEILILQFLKDNTSGITFPTGSWTIAKFGGGGSGSVNAIKDPCRVATTGNNAFHPLWDTTVDGVVLGAGDRFLVKSQTTTQDNGIYIHSGSGIIASTRATDFADTSVQKGSVLVAIQEGSNADTVWMLTTNDVVTIGTTGLDWQNLSASVGDDLGNHTATTHLKMKDFAIFLNTAETQSIIALALANNYIVPVGGAHDFYVNNLVTPKFGINETGVNSNVPINIYDYTIVGSKFLNLGISPSNEALVVSDATLFRFNISSADRFTISTSTNTTFQYNATNGGFVTSRSYRNETTPATNNILNKTQYFGNTLSALEKIYAESIVTATDVTGLNYTGKLEFRVTRNGGVSTTELLRLSSNGVDVFDQLVTDSIVSRSVGLDGIGSASNYYATVNARKYRVLGNNTNPTATDEASITRTSSQGITIKSDTIGSSFGRTVFTDKDGEIRVDFDYNASSKYFIFNYGTGGLKLRRNATDSEALLISTTGNGFSSNDMIINANNLGFGSSNGLLLQRSGISKIRIDADINLLDDTYMVGADLIMNAGDIISAGTITPSITNSAYQLGLDSSNNRWHTGTINSLLTQNITLRDSSFTGGQTGLLSFVTSVGIDAVSAISNARFRFTGMDPSVQIGNAFFVDTNDSSGLRSHTSGMFHESASGVSPKLLSFVAWDDIVIRCYGETSSSLSRFSGKAMTKAGDITTGELPSGYGCFVINTSAGTRYMAINDGGVIRKAFLA